MRTRPTLARSSVPSPFGHIYPPFLQEAIDHAERLIVVLESLDPSRGRSSSATWLVGRVEEVECLVGALVLGWRRGEYEEPEAARSVTGYVQVLHKGLAIQFGELAPACCVDSLSSTATPVKGLSTTKAVPPSTRRGEAPAETCVEEVLEVGTLG